jgi:hypothetical protein
MLIPILTDFGTEELLGASLRALESTPLSRRRYSPLPPEYFRGGAGGTGTGRGRLFRKERVGDRKSTSYEASKGRMTYPFSDWFRDTGVAWHSPSAFRINAHIPKEVLPLTPGVF